MSNSKTGRREAFSWVISEIAQCARAVSLAVFAFVPNTLPLRADGQTCPKSMSAKAEAVLMPVLVATSAVLQSDNWFDKNYEGALDKLLAGKDDASIEARVALMDYPIGTAYAELLSCTVSTGGKRALYYLELYSRCDIAPSHSPVLRDHSRELRASTIAEWKLGKGKGSCEYDK